jgi:hypothetical protein
MKCLPRSPFELLRFNLRIALFAVPNSVPKLPNEVASRAVWLVNANVSDWDCVASHRWGELLNRYTGQNLYRGFESLPLRQFLTYCKYKLIILARHCYGRVAGNIRNRLRPWIR